jgi:hypothetical protein
MAVPAPDAGGSAPARGAMIMGAQAACPQLRNASRATARLVRQGVEW